MGRSALSSLLLLVAALTGCGSFRDLFSAHADVAAEAGSHGAVYIEGSIAPGDRAQRGIDLGRDPLWLLRWHPGSS